MQRSPSLQAALADAGGDLTEVELAIAPPSMATETAFVPAKDPNQGTVTVQVPHFQARSIAEWMLAAVVAITW